MSARTPHDPLHDDTVMAALRRLVQDGVTWLLAEVALAKEELTTDGRRLKLAALFGVIFSIALTAAVFHGSVLLVLVLAPSVGGLTNAVAIGAAGMLAVATLMASLIWRLVCQPSAIASVLKRWRLVMNDRDGGQE